MNKPGIGLLNMLSKLFFISPDSEHGSVKTSTTEQRPFSFDIEHLPEDDCIKITTHGTYTKEADAQLVEAGVMAVQKHRTKLVLIDERDQVTGMTYLESYDLHDSYARPVIPHNLRVAIIFKPTKENLSRYRLYENRSVINGYKHHVFTDERSARAWLFESRQLKSIQM